MFSVYLSTQKKKNGVAEDPTDQTVGRFPPFENRCKSPEEQLWHLLECLPRRTKVPTDPWEKESQCDFPFPLGLFCGLLKILDRSID